MSLKRIWLVDVAGIEPATPCLQSRPDKILTALSGVAYTDNQQDSRSPNVPKLYRVGPGLETGRESAQEGNEQDKNGIITSPRKRISFDVDT